MYQSIKVQLDSRNDSLKLIRGDYPREYAWS